MTSTSILLARHKIVAAEKEIQRKAAPVEIVVPSVPVQAGDIFSEQNLARRSVPVSGTSTRNVPAAEFELLIGGRAKGNLSAGEPLLWTDVEEPLDSEKFSLTIPAGRRAFTFEADISSSFAGLIRPGDSVDLLCEGENGLQTRTWIRGIAVISVNRHFSRIPTKEESQEVSTMTVSVTPMEGSFLAAAARGGRIHWFLRNPNEPPEPAATHRTRTKQPVEIIEIWKAGLQEFRPSIPIGESG